MDKILQITKNPKDYTKALAKGLLIALLTGVSGGVIGSLFHISVDYATHFRSQNTWVVFLLSFGALLVTMLYAFFKKHSPLDTNRVFECVRNGEKIPVIMLPLVFIGATVSHLTGASVGREGAALQLGGSCGYGIGKILHLKSNSIRIAVMSGMSAVFTALFGTPVAASVFSLEVTSVGSMHYGALLPCIISSVIALGISSVFGVEPVRFASVAGNMASVPFVAKVIVLSVLCALVSIVFCTAIKGAEKGAKRIFKNSYVRAVSLGFAVLVLTWCVGTHDYNGAGMNIIEKALSGEASYEAFALKILFTAFSLAAGFKGGEIVPAFFVGSTFGCAFAPLLGLDPSLGAAIGFVSLFCGAVNCPLASVFLATEIFGGSSILMFSLVCAVSYMMSGKYSLYKSQTILYSKIDID